MTQGNRLNDILGQIKGDSLPPVEQWNPDFCGHIDMVIHSDGRWSYMKTPITRTRMVKLFSRVLRKEADGSYVLVTPVEKLGIQVEDAPFVATLAERFDEADTSPTIVFHTNVGDRVVLDADHPLRVETTSTGEPRPYVLVRGGLEALISRAVFYDLAEWATEENGMLVVRSAGACFPLGPVNEAQSCETC